MRHFQHYDFRTRRGCCHAPSGRRRETLATAIARTIRRFGARIYPFDMPAALAAVKIMESARAQGLGLHQIPQKLPDLQIAGIASAYGLELATRNTTDFQGTGLSLIDPWASSE